ncbi:MAG: hypothetical protein ABIL22_02115 [candidate division WOR-3 bacterium]
MQLLLVFFLLEPKTVLELPDNFTTFELWDKAIYLVQFNGKSIMRIDSAGGVVSIPVTFERNMRIYNFKMTPFSIYLHTATGIQRFFLNSGNSESIYKDDVVSFVLTNTEDVVLVNRLKNELIFLDPQNKVRLRKNNVNAIDMDYHDNKIYVLTRKEVLVIDDYGNTIETIKIPEKMSRIVVSEDIFLFSPQSNTIYKKDMEWKRIELRHSIMELKVSGKNIFVLDQYGSYLYMYDVSDF